MTINLGVNNLAQEIKKMYIGVDSKARRVKRAYLGVGGVAQLVYEYEYTIASSTTSCTALDKTSSLMAAVTTDKYAVFAGGDFFYGYWHSSNSNSVNAWGSRYFVNFYDSSLTKNSTTRLDIPRGHTAGAVVGNYIIVAGGYANRQSDNYQEFDYDAHATNVIDIYDASTMTKINTTLVLSSARYAHGATTVGNYAIFSGNKANAINSSLTLTTTSQDIRNYNYEDYGDDGYLKEEVDDHYLACATVGDYAIFKTIDSSRFKIFNSSLTYSTSSSSGVIRYRGAATAINDYALFAGGRTAGTINEGSSYERYNSSTVECLNSSLVLSNPTDLSYARYYLSGAAVNEHAVFSGTDFDIYDSSLTRNTVDLNLFYDRCRGGAAVGNYVLFAGGWWFDSDSDSDTGSDYTNSVTALSIS